MNHPNPGTNSPWTGGLQHQNLVPSTFCVQQCAARAFLWNCTWACCVIDAYNKIWENFISIFILSKCVKI